MSDDRDRNVSTVTTPANDDEVIIVPPLTRALNSLAKGRAKEAKRTVRDLLRQLRRDDPEKLLVKALTTHGVAIARCGNDRRAKEQLKNAIAVAEGRGDLIGAAYARLALMEELGRKIPAPELAEIYKAAASVLQASVEVTTLKRLVACADVLLKAFMENQLQEVDVFSWEGFSLRREVRSTERKHIERALRDAGGAVTKAAHLLGFKHHQSLISIINRRHKDLLDKRTPVRKRRAHLFSEPRRQPAK